MQGWRVHMEDAHTHILSLPEDPSAAFFAVFDGHGGADVAQYAGKHLHKFVVKRPEYESDPGDALQQSFLDMDDAMLEDEQLQEQLAGSTAVTVLIKDNKLYCANAGDSRAVACINGRVDVLSLDHKPNSDIEKKRICEAGGFVEYNRVNGSLALSRALGDFVFKRNTSKTPQEQIVTGETGHSFVYLQMTITSIITLVARITWAFPRWSFIRSFVLLLFRMSNW